MTTMNLEVIIVMLMNLGITTVVGMIHKLIILVIMNLEIPTVVHQTLTGERGHRTPRKMKSINLNHTTVHKSTLGTKNLMVATVMGIIVIMNQMVEITNQRAVIMNLITAIRTKKIGNMNQIAATKILVVATMSQIIVIMIQVTKGAKENLIISQRIKMMLVPSTIALSVKTVKM